MTLYPPWTKPKEDCDLGLCYNNKIVWWWWWFGGGGGLTRCCCVASLRAWPCCEPFRRLVSLSGANLHSSLLRERSAKCHSGAFRSESDFQSVCTAELHFFSFFGGAQLDVFCTTRAVIWHIYKGFWGLATVLLSRSLALHLYIFYLFIYCRRAHSPQRAVHRHRGRERSENENGWSRCIFPVTKNTALSQSPMREMAVTRAGDLRPRCPGFSQCLPAQLFSFSSLLSATEMASSSAVALV